MGQRLAKGGRRHHLQFFAATCWQVVDDILREAAGLLRSRRMHRSGAVRAAVQQVAQYYGKIDILVNNAGLLAFWPITDFPVNDFEKALSVNVRSVFTATQESVRHMPDGGRIITIGAVNSERVPVQGASVYALTKGAVATFTKGLARDLGDRKITVNNIQPGPVDTEANPAGGPFAATMLGFMALKRYGPG
jgi:3-oxoacyl-[acyl-carrier protein] reductase